MPKLITHLPPPHQTGGVEDFGVLGPSAFIQEPWNIALVFTRQLSHNNPLHPAAFISAHLVDMALIDSGTFQSPLYCWAEALSSDADFLRPLP